MAHKNFNTQALARLMAMNKSDENVHTNWNETTENNIHFKHKEINNDKIKNVIK
jgi:hypothetical protein